MHHEHHDHRHHGHGHRWQRVAGFGLLIILGVAAITWVVTQLWNALLTALFGWHSITFLQALGLLALGRIFFGGWHRGGHHHGWRHRDHGGWTHLSDEEREQLRARFRHHCCGMEEHDSKLAESKTS